MAIALVFLALALAPGAARAGWTFCVADGSGGNDVWISGVFAAPADRERLESDFKTFLKAHGVTRPVVQCPEPNDGRAETMDARTVAAEFHRKLGDPLHEIPAGEFEPRR